MTFRELITALQSIDLDDPKLDSEIFGCDGDRNVFWAGSLELGEDGKLILSGTDHIHS
jgi:hypothetical protein